MLTAKHQILRVQVEKSRSTIEYEQRRTGEKKTSGWGRRVGADAESQPTREPRRARSLDRFAGPVHSFVSRPDRRGGDHRVNDSRAPSGALFVCRFGGGAAPNGRVGLAPLVGNTACCGIGGGRHGRCACTRSHATDATVSC
jgi:hypothetical protein